MAKRKVKPKTKTRAERVSKATNKYLRKAAKRDVLATLAKKPLIIQVMDKSEELGWNSKKGKKKKVIIRPKHKILLKKISDNLGKGMTEGEAMRDLGYSKSYSESSQLKDTDSWNALLDQELGEGHLLKRHRALLDKEEILTKNNNKKGTVDQIKTGQPHSDVKGALDMAYKLKKKYGDVTITHKFGELSDEELEAEIAGRISDALKAIARAEEKTGK